MPENTRLRTTPRGWERHALCASMDSREADSLFFPVAESADAAAKAFETACRFCPVRHLCLTTAVEEKREGLWAGTRTVERAKLQRRRSRTGCPVCCARDVIRVVDRVGGDESSLYEICHRCGSSWSGDRDTVPELVLTDADAQAV